MSSKLTKYTNNIIIQYNDVLPKLKNTKNIADIKQSTSIPIGLAINPYSISLLLVGKNISSVGSVLYPNKTLLYPMTAAVAGAIASAPVSKLQQYKNPPTIVIVVTPPRGQDITLRKPLIQHQYVMQLNLQ